MTETTTGLELRSEVTPQGKLRLTLEEVAVPTPGPDEVVVRIEAAPINPSDLRLLIGPADLSTMVVGGTDERPGLTFAVPADRMPALRARLGQSMPVGNEGAGTVVATGSGTSHLAGRRVGFGGGGTYAQYRTVSAAHCLVLPDGASAADGASTFVNPLTSLGFVETMRAEGHRAIVHTAAASNLGQMLNRICLADDIPLVNIVRSPQQVAILRDMGAAHVLDSGQPDFRERLVDAIVATGATLAFDAIGGGRAGGEILAAMEQAAGRAGGDYDRYGSGTFKQLYIYGSLDLGPTILERQSFGFSWSASGWLLTPFLAKTGGERLAELRKRIADELTTTFASRYTRTISLSEALQPGILASYERKATGEKYLIDPSR
ncbi:zinc-binding dehydrogenase [Sphingomonas bacterium]|uniref:zinc-binding dehydrogenase n=1 Tax=Sphingomonas bacterium TaxID=1895847 RepID=UPI001576C4A2|nr:zinc-binding dehydrogenase [Sphingomonas bacterium]